MKIIQSRLFEQRVKRFSKAQKLALDEQVLRIARNPGAGTEKRGDLRGVFVHKFKIRDVQYLLAYRVKEQRLELIMIGPHQNYYRDLKRYLGKK